MENLGLLEAPSSQREVATTPKGKAWEVKGREVEKIQRKGQEGKPTRRLSSPRRGTIPKHLTAVQKAENFQSPLYNGEHFL